jgi:hypothetical protein|tara:strand:+ start:1753 stop:1965 length:213 start_codon:yes stop_codon:yes gene_type:complete
MHRTSRIRKELLPAFSSERQRRLSLTGLKFNALRHAYSNGIVKTAGFDFALLFDQHDLPVNPRSCSIDAA